MRSPLFGLMLAFVLTGARAAAQPAAAPNPPVWPPDCTRNMPRDGLVLLDSALFPDAGGAASNMAITLQRTSDGAPVAGSLAAPSDAAGEMRRWISQAPLTAGTEYKLEAQPLGAGGQPLGAKLVSYFTTGDAFLQPLAFGGRPAVRVMARAPNADDTAEIVVLRVALPPLDGGLPQRRLQLSATLSESEAGERDAALHDSEVLSVLPGQTLSFELEAQLGEAPSLRCVAITARDDLGQEISLDPELCVNLPARTGASTSARIVGPGATEEAASAELPDEDAEGAATRDEDDDASDGRGESDADQDEPLVETSTSRSEAGSATEASQAGATDGCSLGPSNHAALAWLWVALPLLYARRRRTFYPGNIDQT